MKEALRVVAGMPDQCASFPVRKRHETKQQIRIKAPQGEGRCRRDTEAESTPLRPALAEMVATSCDAPSKPLPSPSSPGVFGIGSEPVKAALAGALVPALRGSGPMQYENRGRRRKLLAARDIRPSWRACQVRFRVLHFSRPLAFLLPARSLSQMQR
jgi:hypothetical protein